MDNKVIQAAIAGLLHDIGKLEQRARADPWNPAPGTEEEGQPVHASWSIYFSDQYVARPYKSAAFAGAYHHSPEKNPAADKSLSQLISLADCLSAGERADQPGKKESLPQQMVSIFNRVSLTANRSKDKWNYLALGPLGLNKDSIFPRELLSGSECKDAYEKLCERVRTVAAQDPGDDLTYIENILGALQTCTWAVPSAYYHSIPDVSLYDHSRMTAAIAVCLADREPDDINSMLEAVRSEFRGKASETDRSILDQPAVLLVGGDISGVQDFIYTLTSKGAARMLRGRSFYLQLLTEAVLRFVLHELDIPYTNVIYSGGGHFYLLAPLKAADKLPGIRREITEILLEHHGTSLYLAIGSAPVPASGFRVGRFPAYWGEMHANLAQAKRQRYTELGESLYGRIFEPPSEGGNPVAVCSVCGGEQRKVNNWELEATEKTRICSLCKSFIEEIGKRLPFSRFVALGFRKSQATEPGSAGDVLRSFGMQTQFLESADQTVELPGAERVVIWALDEPDNDRWPSAGKIPAALLSRYSVNRIPLDSDGHPLTFDELKEKVKGGFKRLGVLRLDVDNLGDIFKSGLGDTATLARLSTLSFHVGLYFEGWIKKICEMEPYQGLIYPVYAGGDDAFLIGPWDIMPGLAQQIACDFKEYTSNNPDLHLSAGLAFIGGKYPVYQAAGDAHKALQQAKDLPGKAAFSFIDTAFQWSDFEKVAEKHSRLRTIVSGEEGGPQSIIGILRQLAVDEADEAKRLKGRPVWGPWVWRGAYLLKRMAERSKRNKPELEKDILAIRDELDLDNYGKINQWGLAARWTQLENRKPRKENV